MTEAFNVLGHTIHTFNQNLATTTSNIQAAQEIFEQRSNWAKSTVFRLVLVSVTSAFVSGFLICVALPRDAAPFYIMWVVKMGGFAALVVGVFAFGLLFGLDRTQRP
jgi:type IV secretory pathway component VirB8